MHHRLGVLIRETQQRAIYHELYDTAKLSQPIATALVVLHILFSIERAMHIHSSSYLSMRTAISDKCTSSTRPTSLNPGV